MLQEVNCLYCGRDIPANVPVCPHCGAISHYQQRGWRFGARRRFHVLFLLLVIACLAIAVWLPR